MLIISSENMLNANNQININTQRPWRTPIRDTYCGNPFARGEASGAGPWVPWGARTFGPGVPRGPDLRHWLCPQRHLAMAWCRRRQRAALARPGKLMKLIK